MPLTLLFDLDDTLLGNDFDLFLPAYLKLLARHLVNHVAPEKMVHELLAATQKMVQNNDPSLTLEKAFDAAFYPAIGKTKAELYPTLDEFYDRVFASLEPITVHKPAAPQVVKEAFRRGHTLVVATNPLFPLKAVQHRLRWAGLPPEEYPFAALTSYENYHFSKPNPAYYAEIIGQLGWLNQTAVVIGNSLEDDLLPAAEIDLPGYWISDSREALPAGLHPLSAKGPLEGVLAWTETIEAAGLTPKISSPAGLISVLRSTGAAFDTFARKLTEEQWQQRPQPQEWSITEILCHMRDVDLEINIPRIQMVASGSNPFLPGINSDSWTDERSYCEQDGITALRAFIDARQSLISCLENLSPETWKLPARHAIFGPTHLQELVSFMSTHDRSHIQQVVTSAAPIE